MFESSELKEEMVENWDETHFVFNMNNGKTLGFVGDEKVKFADVSSGGEGITMLVRITGGPSAEIRPPFSIFENSQRNYPIQGVADNVPGVSYRTQPKGWMDQRVFLELMDEPRFIAADPYQRKRVVFVDTCGGHNMTNELKAKLDKLNTTSMFLEEKSTDLCHPADSFVIQKIKASWRNKWNQKKVELIEKDEWMRKIRKNGEWSGN